MPWTASTSKMRHLKTIFPYLCCLGLFIFIIVESVKLHFLLQDLKPDEYLRNKTVVQEWRKVVVGGPWDIKHMMAGPICVFVLGPMAMVTMDVFPLAQFPFITANVITTIHVFLSLASFRLLLSPKLSRRRIGASFFFLRQYFDELDGMVARFWMDRHMHTPGRLGFWIDGLSDTVSVIVLVIAFFHLNHRSHNGNNNNNNGNDKNKSSSSSSNYDDYRRLDDGGVVVVVADNGAGAKQRRPCRSCGGIGNVGSLGNNNNNNNNVEDNDDSFSSCSSASKDDIGPPLRGIHSDDGAGDSGSEESQLLIPSASSPSSSSSPSAPLSSSSKKLGRSSSPPPCSPASLSLLRSRLFTRKTAMLVGVIATLSLSCTIWNNACYMYMDLLDVRPACPQKRRVQLKILKSWLSFVIFHCWRVCMPLAFILQCAIAIIVDKTLWFASFVTRVYLWFVVALSIVTVAHLSEIRDVLNNGDLC